jgi:hypothetical protein
MRHEFAPAPAGAAEASPRLFQSRRLRRFEVTLPALGQAAFLPPAFAKWHPSCKITNPEVAAKKPCQAAVMTGPPPQSADPLAESPATQRVDVV